MMRTTTIMIMMMSNNNDYYDSMSFFNGLKRTLKLALFQGDIQTQLFQIHRNLIDRTAKTKAN